MSRPGRNDPCPCLSGKKFKKCCLGKGESSQAPPTLPPEVLAKMRQQMQEEADRRRKYGNVRPLITARHQGHRFIAVGSRLYFHEQWKTFTDFLWFYVFDVMGKEWWREEGSKPLADQHPILHWRAYLVEEQKKLTPDKQGLLSAEPTGIMAAYLLLAYDLYVLRDHSKLQDVVVKRLRHRDQFQGARYELFVAATFIRAGLQFAYEDEGDGSKKHPEFIASHTESGQVIAVEAKARQRMIKGPFDLAEIRPSVRDLLLNAGDKQPAHPLVVFVELNLPPEEPRDVIPAWVPHVNQVLHEIADARGGRSPFGAVFFTNRPHLYGLPGELDASKHFYAAWPADSPISEGMIDILGNAARQYGNVPSKFPDTFNVDPPSNHAPAEPRL
jgi:hypothetical protein